MTQLTKEGTLYIVATPIGNLQDISLRALDTLKSVDTIACEDTRHAKILFDRYDVKTRLISYFEHNKIKRSKEIIDMLCSGENVALISDAGTPGISDPGYRLIHDAIAKGIQVVPIPGANAAVAALCASGLPTDSFIFEGFLPSKTNARKSKLKGLCDQKRTVICYESPHRLIKALQDIESVFGDIYIVCARELTKQYEEIQRQRVSLLIEHYNEQKPRGEFVLLFNTKEG